MFGVPCQTDNESQQVNLDMFSFLIEFVNAFAQPKILPSPHSIDDSIDLIPNVTLSNAPSYHLAPCKVENIDM